MEQMQGPGGQASQINPYKAKKYQHYLAKHQIKNCLQELDTGNQRSKNEAKQRLEVLNDFNKILESFAHQDGGR